MQRTATKENQENNSTDDSETNTKYRTETIESSSWSDLIKRYKNVWKGRFKDKESMSGISAVFMTVVISAVLSALISASSVSSTVTAVPSAVVLGTMGGVIVSSNAYDLDSFVNAHIGLALGFILGVYQTIILTMGGSSIVSIGATAVVSFLYMLFLSVAMVGYGIVGKWIRSVRESKNTGV